MVKIKTTKHGQNIKIKDTATIFGIVMLIVVGMINRKRLGLLCFCNR